MTAAALPIPDTDAYVAYTVTTSTTGPFIIPFPLPLEWEGSLRCSVGGIELSTTNGFIFTPDSQVGSGYPSGLASLVLAAELTSVVFWRDTPITRSSDFGVGPLDFDAFNAELARLTMQVQDARLRSKYSELWTGGASTVAIAAAITDVVQASSKELGIYLLSSGTMTTVSALVMGNVSSATAEANVTALHAKQDEVAAAGGGIIDLPRGTLCLGAFRFKSNVKLRGNGTILKAKANLGVTFIEGHNTAALWAGTTADGVHNCGLYDLEIDGNRANQATQCDGVRWYGWGNYSCSEL